MNNAKTDWELVLEYYKGPNEPIGVLMFVRYFDELLTTALRNSRNEDDARDAMQDVAMRLMEYSISDRIAKFRPEPENVLGGIRIRVKRRSQDIRRKHKKGHFSNDDRGLEPGRNQMIQLDAEDKFLTALEHNDLIDQVRKNFEEKKWELELQFLNLMLEYGKGDLQSIADDLNLELGKARAMKLKIKRNIGKILINEFKPTKSNYRDE